MAKAPSSDASTKQKPPAAREGKSERQRKPPAAAYDHQRALSPPDLPDEVLLSDVGRYHILSANRTTTATYQELFRCAPFSLNSWIPSHIATLASRMPGDVTVNTRDLLERKTLYPLFQLFSALSFHEHSSQRRANKDRDDTRQRTHRDRYDSIVAPKRMVIEATRICLACLHDDFRTYGVPYIHLSHQVPGVEVCAQHGIDLIYKCPYCECLFNRHRQLVLAPWRACHCKKYLLDFTASPVKSNNLVALSYAKFTHDLLSAPPMLVQPNALVECYKRRIRELGYLWGDKIHRNRLFKDIEKFYGADFLSRVDPAYKEKRLSGWFTLINDRYVSECPLSRHLLFAHFLFRKSKVFWPGILQTAEPALLAEEDKSAQDTAKLSRSAKNRKSSTLQTKAKRVHDLTLRLLHAAKGIAKCTVEDLWHSNFGSMKQLTRLDPQAVLRLREQLKILKPRAGPARSLSVQPHPDDDARARKFQQAAEMMYVSTDKPERVSGNRLRHAVGWNPYAANRDRFPLAVHAFEEQIESNWHFYARRIVWAMFYLRHGSMDAIRKLSGVEYHRSLVLMEFFRDIDISAPLSKGTVVKLLQQYGIDRHWDGPCPDREFPPAGRGYYENR
jgi:hypothetical protein